VVWPEVSIEDFPPERDDEPSSLREDILDELTDHFVCALNRELLKNPDEQTAKQRVINQFGDPVKIARQLWLDAMKERMMSQRIMTGISAVMAVCSIAVVGIAWMLMRESQGVNQKMLAQLAVIADRPQAESTVVKSLQRTNEAIVRELKILAESQRPSMEMGFSEMGAMGSSGGEMMAGGFGMDAKSAEPSNINQQILKQLEQLNLKTSQQDGSTSEAMNLISFQLVQDNKDKKPAVGFTGRLTKVGTDAFSLNATSDEKGALEFGKLPWGNYDLSLKSPWGEICHISRFAVIPGRNYSQTIICPAAAPEEVPVQFQVDWSEKQKSDDLLLICDFRKLLQAGGGVTTYEFSSSRNAGSFYWFKDQNQPREQRGVYIISGNHQVTPCPLDAEGNFIDVDYETLKEKPSIKMFEGDFYQLPVIYLITKQDLKKLSQLNSLKEFEVNDKDRAMIYTYRTDQYGGRDLSFVGGLGKNNPATIPCTRLLVPFKKKDAPSDSANIYDVISRHKYIDGTQLPELLKYTALKEQPNVWKIKIPELAKKDIPESVGTGIF